MHCTVVISIAFKQREAVAHIKHVRKEKVNFE